MANFEPEPEPNFVSVAHLGDFDSSNLALVLDGNCDEFVSSLQFENPDVVLGDKHIIVPSRIKGKLVAYLEADASQYVLDTISDGIN